MSRTLCQSHIPHAHATCLRMSWYQQAQWQSQPPYYEADRRYELISYPPQAPVSPRRIHAVQKPFIRKPPQCVMSASGSERRPREMEIIKMYRHGRESLQHCHELIQQIASKLPGKVNHLGQRLKAAINPATYLDNGEVCQQPFIDWDNSVLVTPIKNIHTTTVEDTTTQDQAAFPIIKYRTSDMPSNRPFRCNCLPTADPCVTNESSSLPPSTQPHFPQIPHWTTEPQYTHVQPFLNYSQNGQQYVRELPGFTLHQGNTTYVQPDQSPRKQQDEKPIPHSAPLPETQDPPVHAFDDNKKESDNLMPPNTTCQTFQNCPVHGANLQNFTRPAVSIFPIGARNVRIFSTNKRLTPTDEVQVWRRTGPQAVFEVTQLPVWCPPPGPPPLNAQFVSRGM
eukprot:Blabericola_migrator_1__6183@NODE_311_length_10068_cov_114_952505_g254_i0_p3_GENE_NODE_311_length_10068_cov_114_952505_g254_i0NODE_311_length_10068_cov_114_952505_g254_i0_p3_ORF_typecomplete_len396_score46_05_NODE_311_length_10068_cov_114_952505_g254_i063277514